MIDRRDFLKIGGATAFAALFGGCRDVSRKIIPFVVPPENHTLGEALWYASGCRMCPAGCGIVVRVSEGRAKKVEGNPLHPVNRGKLCARGQAALQALYHPERLGQPLKRVGPRGAVKFAPVSWEEALSLLMTNLKTVRAEAPGALLMLTEPMRGHANLVAARFMEGFRSPHRVAWDPFGQDALLAACREIFGVRELPEYDIAQTRYLLSFGGDFLETWVSPVHYSRAYGRMRQGRETVRGKMVHFGSRLSLTAAAADLFLPVAPGTEGAAALGIAHVLVREKLTPAAAGAPESLKRHLAAHAPETVSKRTGLPADDLVAVAREFARNQPGMAIAGTAAGTSLDGTFQHAAVLRLNLLAGNQDVPGGLSFPSRGAAVSRFGKDAPLLAPPPESGYAAVRDAVDGMRKGAIRAALLSGATNPAFTLPTALKFREALGNVPFVAAFASFLDETSSLADLVLPTPTFLEEWGDDVAPAGHDGGAITLLQPAVDPFRDTRPFPDVLLAAAKELGQGMEKPLPWASLRECLEKAYGGPGEAFEKALQAGGFFTGGAAKTRGRASAAQKDVPAGAPGAVPLDGDPAKFPLVLHVYPSVAHYDGRGANLSWLQEMPDPVSTAVWRGWVELNPETAKAMGLSDGDGVTVASPSGAIEAHVAIHPGMAPGVAAMPLGQGHTAYGKNASGRGGNPFALLPAAAAAGGAFPLQSTRVALSKAALSSRLVRAAHPEGQWKVRNLM